MDAVLSYPDRFVGPLTKEQFKAADEGSLGNRVIKKGELGVRGAQFNLAIVITVGVAATCWAYDMGLYDLLDPFELEEAFSQIAPLPDGTYTVLIAPFAEELACRGILQPILIGAAHRLLGGEKETRDKAVIFGVVGQAFLFGGLHGIFPQRVTATSSGLLFGYLKEKTKHEVKDGGEGWATRQALKPVHFFEGLVACFVAHAANNGVFFGVGKFATWFA